MNVKAFAFFGIFVSLCLAEFCAQEIERNVTPSSARPLAKLDAPTLDFERAGPKVGEQLADLSLLTLQGDTQRLGDAWKGGPALLVTSSLTCPKSRSRWPELKTLADKYQDRVNVVILYVIEAHPVGSVCPYKGVEDITPENERDGLLRKQPKTLENRLELAQEFKRLLRIQMPIYVDNMRDEAWKAIGAAPNVALLVDQDGIVAARSGWFEGKKSEEAIENLLRSPKKANEDQTRRDQIREDAERVFAQLEATGFESYDLLDALRDDKSEDLNRMLKAVPHAANLVFESRQGHPYESTALMDAVRAGSSAAVKLLLQHGTDVRARTSSFDSAFQIAAQTGDLAIAKILVTHGADPNLPRTGQSPLNEAALHGHTEFVKLLLAGGLRHNFYSAIAQGEIELVRRGLKADPSRALRPDGAGRMPLDYAAANGQLEIAKLLLAHGAPVVREKRSRMDTPLHRAIARKDSPMTELLLAAGSSPDNVVGQGHDSPTSRPAIHLAVAQKSMAIVKLLLAYNVDLKARDTYSKTALHTAAAAGETALVQALIEGGADVNSQQLGYKLPCGSSEDSIPTLTTPLHLAAASGNPSTLKVLLESRANVNAATKNGETPLMFAAQSYRSAEDDVESRLKNVEFLIASGADINARDHQGRSVLDLAAEARHDDGARPERDKRDVIGLLQKHGARPGAPKKKPDGDPFSQ